MEENLWIYLFDSLLGSSEESLFSLFKINAKIRCELLLLFEQDMSIANGNRTAVNCRRFDIDNLRAAVRGSIVFRMTKTIEIVNRIYRSRIFH